MLAKVLKYGANKQAIQRVKNCCIACHCMYTVLHWPGNLNSSASAAANHFIKGTIMNYVNYQINMTPENAELIDKINSLVLGDRYTASEPAKAAPAKAAPAKAAPPEEEGMSLAQFKTAVKAAKAEHGEEFTKATLVAAGANGAKPLGAMVSAVTDYPAVVATLEAGPTEAAEEEEEDDGLGDDDEDTSEVTADSVKTAAKAYAKEVGRDEAREIMAKHGAASLVKVGDCTAKQLAAMFKDFTA